MRYVKIFILAAAMMAAMACIKENVPENKPEENADLVEMTFTATSDESQTKAAFDEEAYPAIVWEGNESIAVLAANTDQEFTTTSTGKVAEFIGLADIDDTEFYAVYPYDEAIALNGEVLTNVKVPSIQTATEGTFDPKAFVAVAKSNDKKNFTFKAVGGFLKFQVGDEDVKSVTVMANSYTENEGENVTPTIAGTAGVSWSNDNPAHGSSNWTNDKSSSIKLIEDAKGDQFAAGKNYFVTMRANSCPGGITVYVEYDNGEVYSISSTKQLFTSGVQNMIKNLGTFTKAKMTKVDDLYTLYTMGYDLVIGNKTFNVKTTPATKLTASTDNNININTYITQGGLYFLETEGTGKYIIADNANVTKDVILVGNDNTPSVIEFTSNKAINHKSSSLILHNIEIDGTNSTSGQLISNYGSTTNSDAFILDGCKVTVKTILYNINANYKGFICDNFIIKDSDVKFTAAKNLIDLSSAIVSISKLQISNSIFYADNYTKAVIFKMQNNSNTEAKAEIVCERNTIYNLYYGSYTGLIHTGYAKSMTFTNNIVEYGKVEANEYVTRCVNGTPTNTYSNNHYWCYDNGSAENFAKVREYGTTVITSGSNSIIQNSYPFASSVDNVGATR